VGAGMLGTHIQKEPIMFLKFRFEHDLSLKNSISCSFING
jgi:hypothetical protein